MSTVNTYAASIRASLNEKVKISEPGLYSRFSMTKAEKTETPTGKPVLKFVFESTAGDQYANLDLFINQEDFVKNGKVVTTKSKAENDMLAKLLEVCDAIGTTGEMDKFLTSDYDSNVSKLFGYIVKQQAMPNKWLNFRVIMDNNDTWTKMPTYAGNSMYPCIEKYVEGKDNNCRFNQREIEKGLNKRQKPRSTEGYSKSDSSSYGMPSAKPDGYRVDAPLTAQEAQDLPF
jgi:hypothetical protein